MSRLAEPMLIDLSTDAKEARNVAAANPEVVQHMLKLADQARAELGDYQRKGKGQRATGDSRHTMK